MSSNDANKLINICIKKKLRINLAESCTGGLICSKIVSVSNASKVFELGFITYSNASKIKLLGVPTNILSNHGAVSKETAYHMAKGLSKLKNIDFSIATTGIAGPSGATPDKPIGLVYFSFYLRDNKIIVDKKVFKGDRNLIREKAADYALSKSIKIIESNV